MSEMGMAKKRKMWIMEIQIDREIQNLFFSEIEWDEAINLNIGK